MPLSVSLGLTNVSQILFHDLYWGCRMQKNRVNIFCRLRTCTKHDIHTTNGNIAIGEISAYQ